MRQEQQWKHYRDMADKIEFAKNETKTKTESNNKLIHLNAEKGT